MRLKLKSCRRMSGPLALAALNGFVAYHSPWTAAAIVAALALIIGLGVRASRPRAEARGIERPGLDLATADRAHRPQAQESRRA